MPIQQLVKFATEQAGQGVPRYYRQRAIRWVISIDQRGYGHLTNLVTPDAKAGVLMPAPYVTRTSGVAAMLVVDTLEYVFGVAKDDSAKAQAAADKRNDAYLELLHAWKNASGDPVAETVWDFFDQEKHLQLLGELPDDAPPSDLVAVRAAGEYAHQRASAVDFWGQVSRDRKSSGLQGLCLSCHREGSLLKTVPDMIKSSLIPVGVDSKGRPKRGRDAALISINTSAQGRGGQQQLGNTPLCEDCGAQVMAALNHLLSDARHRRRGDDSVLTWWLAEPAAEFDLMMIENPDPGQVNDLLKEIHSGGGRTRLDEGAFHALTLSANQSRVVVRDWLDAPLREIKQNIASWFDDHASVDVWSDGVHFVPLRQLVRASGRWDRGKKQYVPGTAIHGLERALLHAALRGAAPPSHLVPQLLHRIRNDHRIDLPRVALLRLALTRPPFKEATMPGLDPGNTTPAYVWGRTFAVLEALQRRALPDVNATIRDRFFGLAMTQPEATMRLLRTNANGHIKKLTRSEKTRPAGRALDNRLADLAALLDADKGLPSHLNARDQMKFILGYDHQRAHDAAAARAAKEAKASKDAPETAAAESNVLDEA
ncbi:type I-C CRISPR-associated protein Cas8c/Csd1 [Spirillospora sp. NPDC049652]